MKTFLWKGGLQWLLLCGISLLFLVAGIGKLCDLRGFIDDVEVYELLPMWGLIPFAAILPWLEILAAVALWIPKWRVAAAYLAVGLSMVFCVAITSAMFRGIEVSCGCFGAGLKEILGGDGGVGFLARDFVLLLICICLTWSCSQREAQPVEAQGT